ncbi:NAD(P)-binding protein [Serendipita vermifera]|nr:NAD(P)-binding protein [Serendipita vermifera]
MSFTKIVQSGATGNIGAPIFEALNSSNKFELTVLSRSGSKFTAPENVVRKDVDFTDVQSLSEAMKGNDALVITIGRTAGDVFTVQKTLIDAAIEAGVKRVIPAHFGTDTERSPGKDQVVSKAILNVMSYIKEKAEEGKITWTVVIPGLKAGYAGFSIPNRSAILFDGGNSKYNYTLCSTIAQSIVSILSTDPTDTENKALRIHDWFISQNELLDIMDEELAKEGEKDANGNIVKFKRQVVSMDDLVKQKSHLAMLYEALFGPENSCSWGTDDESSLAGVKPKDEEELRKALRGVLFG